MDSTSRFSARVDNYVKYRPTYPRDMIDFLFESGIIKESTVCDIGSGTGILSRLLIDSVKKLIAIEPNNEMRLYAEESLSGYSKYISVNASAEKTTLEDHSVDVICAAQSFHWFDRENSRKEFKRILKPRGKVFLIWNNRIGNTLFLEEYDEMLYKYGTDYGEVNHQNLTDEDFSNFFGGEFHKELFSNYQDFDLEGFLGRVFSSSYTPQEGHPKYDIFLQSLRDLFHTYNDNGLVRFNYQTEVYGGQLDT